MPKCRECGDEVDEVYRVRVEGRIQRLCEDCADRVREEMEIAEESEAVIQEMHRVQYPESEPYFGTLRFGLGWLVFEEEFGRKTHGHDGDLTFSHARMRILPDNAIGIIYFFNQGLRPSIGPRTLSSLMEYGSDTLIRKMLYDKANERVYGKIIT